MSEYDNDKASVVYDAIEDIKDKLDDRDIYDLLSAIFEAGYESGYSDAEEESYEKGYREGYDEGYTEGQNDVDYSDC